MTEKNIIKNALDLAHKSHDGQFRKGNNLSGVKLPYVCHPVDVVNILNKWNIPDENMIAAGFLHDTLEDTSVSVEEIVEATNDIVAYYVKELTHDPNVPKQDYIDNFVDKPIQIFLIKVADRICNVRDFEVSSSDYARKYAKKADKIFKSLFKRYTEIDNTFGSGVSTLIHKDVPIYVKSHQ